MYDNDYSISLAGVTAWLTVAALVGGCIAFVRRDDIRNWLLVAWYLFPAAAMTILCVVLYFVLPDDRYMSPVGGHWLVMLSVAAVLAFLLTPPWAAAAWIAAKLMRRYRGNPPHTNAGTVPKPAVPLPPNCGHRCAAA